MTSNSIGFYCSTYVTTRYDTVECIESKKSEGQTSKQTNKHTNKQTNQRRRKDYSRRATITKDYTSPALAGAGDYN